MHHKLQNYINLFTVKYLFYCIPTVRITMWKLISPHRTAMMKTMKVSISFLKQFHFTHLLRKFAALPGITDVFSNSNINSIIVIITADIWFDLFIDWFFWHETICTAQAGKSRSSCGFLYLQRFFSSFAFLLFVGSVIKFFLHAIVRQCRLAV